MVHIKKKKKKTGLKFWEDDGKVLKLTCKKGASVITGFSVSFDSASKGPNFSAREKETI